MATYQELRTRSQQVRDEQNIGGNTALRVGQLLMDIVKYFNDNDAAASEYLQQHFAMVNDGTHLLNWHQSPIVILHTMGETYDDGDFSALSQGENYYRAGFIMEANGRGGGGINGETPKANVLYVNLANDTLYTWNGASFDAITTGGGGGSISGDDIIKNAYYSNGNLVLIIETESGDKTVTIPVTFDASNYVPTSRTVNGKALSNNITLSQSDIPGLVAALAALVPQSRTINEKPLTGNVTIGMNDIPGLVEAIANAGSGAVSVTTNQDNTFVIHVGSTDYLVNLNHTHAGMAKLVKCTEETLPQTMEDDTIYVQVDDLQSPGEIQKLYLFGLAFEGGGGVIDETPRLTSPGENTEIDFNGASSTTLRVKGLYLGSQLTITNTGDLAITANGSAVSTISANDANNGIELTIAKGANYVNEDCSLTISSSEVSRTVVVKDSAMLPGGLFANKAWATPSQSHQKPVELSGYCITKFFKTQKDSSTLKCSVTVHSGVTIVSSGLAWIGTGWNKKTTDNTAFDENTTDARGYYSDPRNFQIGTGDGTCISATFKTSEIANCYIYDHIAGAYLWAGENVDTSVAPPIPS